MREGWRQKGEGVSLKKEEGEGQQKRQQEQEGFGRRERWREIEATKKRDNRREGGRKRSVVAEKDARVCERSLEMSNGEISEKEDLV